MLGSGAPNATTAVSNVHGVREECLAVGRARVAFAATAAAADGSAAAALPISTTAMTTTSRTVGGAAVGPFYFLAKKQLAKGYRELLNLAQSPDVLALLDEV